MAVAAAAAAAFLLFGRFVGRRLSSSSLDSAISICCDFPEDEDLCRSILDASRDNTDRERLLVVQFLEFHLRPTDYIGYVLMPILFDNEISEDFKMVLLECSKSFKEEKAKWNLTNK